MTALGDLIADDWEIFDGIEDITLIPNNRDPSRGEKSSVKALVGNVTKRDVQQLTLAGLEPADVSICLWKSTCGQLTPQQNDVIERSDRSRYIILSTVSKTLDTRFICLCRKEIKV